MGVLEGLRQPVSKKDYLALCLILCSLFVASGFFILSLRDIYGIEARTGLFVRSLFLGKGFFCPVLYDRPYPDYPSFYFLLSWLACLPQKCACSFCLSAPSLFSGAMLVFFVYVLTRKHIGEKTAICSSLILFATPHFWLFAQRATVDMLLALLSFLANILFYEGCVKSKSLFSKKSLTAFGLMALSYLTKGPIGLILCILPTAIFLTLKGEFAFVCRFMAMGAAVSALTLAVHFTGIFYQGGPNLIHKVIYSQLFSRLSGHANKPFYYYFVFILLTFSPWLLLSAFLRIRKGGLVHRPYNLDEGARRFHLFVLLYLLSDLAPFVLASSRHARYLLPIFPPISILLSVILLKGLGTENKKTIHKKMALLIFAILAGLFLLLSKMEFLGTSLPMMSALGYLLVFSFCGTLLLMFSSNGLLALASLCFFLFFLTSSASLLIVPGLSKKESGRSFVLATEGTFKASKGVYLVGIKPDGDGLKYSLYSRFYPKRLHFMKEPVDACSIPHDTIAVLYDRDLKILNKNDACKGYSVISRGYIHSKRVVSIMFSQKAS